MDQQEQRKRRYVPYAGWALAFCLLSIEPIFFPYASLAAITLTVLTYVYLERSGSVVRDISLATIAVLITLCCFPMTFVAWAMHHRPPAHQPMCTDHQKQIALAVIMYAQEYDDTLPGTPGVRTSWRDHGKTSIDISDKLYRCPSSTRKRHKFDYGYNDYLLGAKASTVATPETMVLTADSDLGTTLCSQADITPRHLGRYLASFVDGHVNLVLNQQAARLR